MTEPRDENGYTGDIDLSGRVPVAAPPTANDVMIPEVSDHDDEAAVRAPRPPRTLKGAAVLSARVVSGLTGLAVATAVIAATVAVPLPSVTVQAPAVTVIPVAAEQQRVCAGPLLRLGDDSGAQATTASSLGAPEIVADATRGEVDQTAATDSTGGDAASAIVSLPTRGEKQERLAASQSQAAARGDFVGAAAAECLEPRDDTWLVGGATTTGRTSLLTIVNPGEVAAVVDITVYSDSGATTAPGTTGIAIPPGEQRVYSLAGLAPGLASPVVRVQSEGALVAATLQQSTVRTLEPGGLDFVTASAAPATELTIPGIVFPDHDGLEAAIVGEDFLDLNPALRVFVPGDEQAHAVFTMVRVLENGSAASEAPVDITVTLDAGRVTELPVSEFEAGRYVALVTSDVPVVAGIRTAVVGSTGANDFAWLSSVESHRERAFATVAEGANPVMTLYNPTDGETEVTLGHDDDLLVEIAPRSAVSVPVIAGESYVLDGFDELHVGVDFAGDGTITSHTVSPRAPGSTPIVIYP